MFLTNNNVHKTLLAVAMLTSNTGFTEIETNTLTIEKATQIALERDFVIKSYFDNSNAKLQESIALDTLPDPKLKFGFLNYPDDTFKSNQEPMTQKKIGIVQMFPKGSSNKLKSQQAIIHSESNLIKASLRKRQVIEFTRKAWLELYYWSKAKKILDENRILFKDLVNISEGQYAVGKRRQSDFVQAQLELDLLNDKDFMFNEKIEIARADLSNWVGKTNSNLSLSSELTELHEDIKLLDDAKKNQQSITALLLTHPMILMTHNSIKYSQKTVELARQDYKPAWSLDLSYGVRDGYNPNGTERSNFVSAMVKVDIPLFTANRQDKNVASKLKMVSAARNNMENMRQVMTTQLAKSHTRLIWLKQRIKHFRTILSPRAKQNSEAALVAYQSDRSDFMSLIKARFIEFNTQLQFLRLNVDHVTTEATLSYLLGEIK